MSDRPRSGFKSAAPIAESARVRIEKTAADAVCADTFEEGLHIAASGARLSIGAHQSALSYLPDGSLKSAIHAHSQGEKYEKHDPYDVMSIGEVIWALVVEERGPVRMTQEELAIHPDWKGVGCLLDARGLEYPQMRGWLAVPILAKDGGFLGVLQVSDRFEGNFSEDDQTRLTLLGKLISPLFELEYLSHKLRRTEAELARSNADLDDFARVVAHDLKEPARKIQAFGERLDSVAEADLSEEARDYLGRMIDASERLTVLIGALLSYAQVSSRAQHFVPVDLGKVASEVIEDLQARILETKGRVEVADLPRVLADPIQMHQLLLNLIGNALKFHRGNISPVVKVYVEAGGQSQAQGGACRFVVEDNGIGFDPKHDDRIFGVFERLHGRGEYEGTGLGLAICRKIVERHLGEISARARPGEGATFVITLPISLPT